MSAQRGCPGLEELNAYVDGELDEPRRAALEAHLANCPEDAQRVAGYRRGDELLRTAFDELYRGQPLPERIQGRLRQRRNRRLLRLSGLAASVTLVAAMAFGAWWLHGSHVSDQDVELAHTASTAYRLYAVGPAARTSAQAPRGREELSRWLSNQIGKPMRVPDLDALGFRLVGVRLLPGAAAPAAQLVYQDSAGRRVACYFVARNAPDQEQLHFVREGSVQTFYRVDEDLGYAVSGELNRTELRAIAEAAYRSSEEIEPPGGPTD